MRLAEAEIKCLQSIRVLVQQVAQISSRFMFCGDCQEHVSSVSASCVFRCLSSAVPFAPSAQPEMYQNLNLEGPHGYVEPSGPSFYSAECQSLKEESPVHAVKSSLSHDGPPIWLELRPRTPAGLKGSLETVRKLHHASIAVSARNGDTPASREILISSAFLREVSFQLAITSSPCRVGSLSSGKMPGKIASLSQQAIRPYLEIRVEPYDSAVQQCRAVIPANFPTTIAKYELA